MRGKTDNVGTQEDSESKKKKKKSQLKSENKKKKPRGKSQVITKKRKVRGKGSENEKKKVVEKGYFYKATYSEVEDGGKRLIFAVLPICNSFITFNCKLLL